MESRTRAIPRGAGRCRPPAAEGRRGRRAALLPLIGLLLLGAVRARAAETLSRADAPGVTGLYVVREGGMLAVHGRIERLFTPALLEHLQAGLPLTLKLRFEVYRQLTRWPDPRIATRTVQRTATYDRLRREYLLLEETAQGVDSRPVADLDALRSRMGAIRGEPLLPWQRLDPGRYYYVRVQARIKTEPPAFPFDRLLFFAPRGWTLSDWSYSGNLTRTPGP